MNYEQIETCVIGARSGNREELLKIFEQYKLFIFKTAGQFFVKDFGFEDMVQIGYVALIKAVGKYRTGSNTFSTYAYNAITNTMKQTARNNSKFRRQLSLNAMVDVSGNSQKEFLDCVAGQQNIEEEMLKSERTIDVRRAISKLNSDEIELINSLFYQQYSLRDYAQNSGLSYLQASRKKSKVFEKLSKYIKQ